MHHLRLRLRLIQLALFPLLLLHHGVHLALIANTASRALAVTRRGLPRNQLITRRRHRRSWSSAWKYARAPRPEAVQIRDAR